MSAVARHTPATCPRCGVPILWVDGEPAPELVYVIERGESKAVGCRRCFARRAASPPSAPGPRPRPAPDPGPPIPLRERVAKDMAGVVPLVNDGLDLVDRVANFWRKLKGPSK